MDFLLFIARSLGGLLLSMFLSSAFAWDAHVLLTDAALKDMPEIQQLKPVPIEPLSQFLRTEQAGLTAVIQNTDAWASAHVYAYPNTPLPAKFFTALFRINPTAPLPAYIKSVNALPWPQLPKEAIMLREFAKLPWIRVVHGKLYAPPTGTLLDPLQIILTSVDEPDYGLDINLWEDNHSSFANAYHFGPQPFGNVNLPYSTQAPFHMGFYYETPTIYFFAPFLQRSFPEYRIALYLNLAQYAFKTHHDYWGYRFLGWALHYIQDLTQPYHANAAPGFSTFAIISKSLLAKLSITHFKNDAIQLLSNRHFALEDYLYFRLNADYQHNSNSPFILALKNTSQDQLYPPFSYTYPRDTVAKEAFAIANQINNMIVNTFPTQIVNNPHYIFYITDPNIDITRYCQQNLQEKEFDAELTHILTHIGAHTRNTIKFMLTLANKIH